MTFEQWYHEHIYWEPMPIADLQTLKRLLEDAYDAGNEDGYRNGRQDAFYPVTIEAIL